MGILDYLGKEILFFDGAMGTMLQEAGLKPGENPDCWCITDPLEVQAIHAAYLAVGCNVLMTNTFGCTSAKLAGTGYTAAEVAAAATRIAREAVQRDAGAQPKFVALDVGPCGKLLEPLGDLAFEDAVSMFSESIAAGEREGADLVIIETMSDTYELKAAVLAAKESSRLPVIATVVPDTKGKLLTGGDIASVVALLEGLRVDALGLNCGLGPAQMLPLLEELRQLTSLPIMINPNAGLPREQNGTTVYDVEPGEFSWLMQRAVQAGAHVLGGCCGTTPAHMQALIGLCRGMPLLPVEQWNHTVISSYGRTITFTDAPVLIGERINPTGKPRLKQALREGNYDYILGEGIRQQQAGAHVLDVNAGLPEINEQEVLPQLVQRLQSVIDLPLQIDTANPAALAKAMRLYNGKPMVNSVNGKEGSLDDILPLVQKYGGLLVALTLDEHGIPETPEGRAAIAEKIIDRAAAYGIARKDIIVDTLTMAASAGEGNGRVTLEALRLVKQLGVKTSLGVSNVSFGLPRRDVLNAGFFSLAIGAGLDAAIMNPNDASMMQAYDACRALLGRDALCANFIEKYKDSAPIPDAPPTQAGPAGSAGAGSTGAAGSSGGTGGSAGGGAGEGTLRAAVRQGLKSQALTLAQEALKTCTPLQVIEEQLAPALNEVGEAYEKGSIFLPQLLMSAEAAKSAFTALHEKLGGEAGARKGKVVLATVEGDVHDIGKNIVRALLENYQFEVIDLGKDVPPERVLAAAKQPGVDVVGLSALMTTTVSSMQHTIQLLKAELPSCPVMVGGAVLTKEYAQSIGADHYGKDAMSSVRYVQKICAGKEK